jgi:ATP-dependent RNA helicase DeaD
MQSFAEMGLAPNVTHSLTQLKFEIPTPIQSKAIPVALQGRDILGSAQTGTGKTLAFTVPMIESLLKNPESTALIIVPTRELAQQVVSSVRDILSKGIAIRTALLIGGESITRQYRQLKDKPRIIVGTPGRIIDHLKQKTVHFNNAQFVALDEMDRMFDMGFSIQIAEIMKRVPQNRQTLMFSATLAPNIEKIAGEYLNNPERISVGSLTSPIAKIKQDILKVADKDKYEELLTQLNQREGSIIVFVKTKFGAEKLADKLIKESHKASAIHGDLRQHKREKVINSFRNGRERIMVATDVAARGLDIPHIQHVINYDLPQCPEDYIHRIGRTGRAGAEGQAICFVSPQESKLWRAIDALINGGEHIDTGNNRGGGRGGRSGGGRDQGRGRREDSNAWIFKDKNSSSERSFSPRSRDGDSAPSFRRDRDDSRPSFKRREFDDSRPRRAEGSDRKDFDFHDARRRPVKTFGEMSIDGRPESQFKSTSSRGEFSRDARGPKESFSRDQGSFDRKPRFERDGERSFDRKPGGFSRSSSSEGRPGGFNRSGSSEGRPGGFSRSGSSEGRPGGFSRSGSSEGRPGGFSRSGSSEGRAEGFGRSERSSSFGEKRNDRGFEPKREGGFEGRSSSGFGAKRSFDSKPSFGGGDSKPSFGRRDDDSSSRGSFGARKPASAGGFKKPFGKDSGRPSFGGKPSSAGRKSFFRD